MATSDTTKGAPAMRALILGLLLGMAMTINSYGQPPSTPASGATAYFIKFRVKPGMNADFEKAIGEMMVKVREKEPGNIYCDLLHLPQDTQTYVVMERYKDIASSKEHGESEYIKKLGAELNKGMLDGPPELQELIFIRSK